MIISNKTSFTFRTFLLVVATSASTAFLAAPAPKATQAAHPKIESAYDRVMRTNELRCGYYNWNPAFIKDPNTGKLSGIFHDYMEELGKIQKIKIIWQEEIGLADYPAALKSGRIDAMCSSIYVTSERARVTDFITPAYFVPIHLYGRKNDNRFDNVPVQDLNQAPYTVAILEGGVTSILQRYYFPNAKVYELPQLTSPAELFSSLDAGKADFLLYDKHTFYDFDSKNPNRLKILTESPIKVFPLAIAVDKNQDALREMLNTSTMDLHLSGKMSEIIKRYELYEDSFIPMALPYQTK